MTRRRWSFFAVCLAVTATWLVVLPAASDSPWIRRLQAAAERGGYNPAAIFYSELEDGVARGD